MITQNGPRNVDIFVGPLTSGRRRLVIATQAGSELYRDTIDCDSARGRTAFLRRVAERLPDCTNELDRLGRVIVERADEADALVDESRGAESLSAGGRAAPHSEQLVAIGREFELFHDAESVAYASFEVDGHMETWPLRSAGSKRRLAYLSHARFGKVTGTQAVQEALNVLEGHALFEGPQREIHVRVAEHQGEIFFDLGDPEWRTIRIGPGGWGIATSCPIRFRRPRGMYALPLPERGGTLEDLFQFLNVSEENLPLLAGWLIAAASPCGPFPILVLTGEHGTAKSTTAASLRSIVDPNKADLRGDPRNAHDLVISARNGWILAFDNLSYVPPWLSDALCRLSTGGGFGTRELFSDAEEVLFEAQRPIVINSIEDAAVRSDFLDRAIILPLAPIADNRRRTERCYWQEFNRARPRILGALFDALATGLRNLPHTILPTMPRMADFATWVVAAEPSLGIPAGSFLSRYAHNRESANAVALEASPMFAALQLVLFPPTYSWRGTATDLLSSLESRTSEATRKQWGWPKSPRALSGTLRRIAPNLRRVGIVVDFAHSGNRIITIGREAQNCVQSVQPP